MNYQCPVCGYQAMPYAAVPYNICPCCGTEFGVDDRTADHDTLQRAWESNGYPWFDDITSPPLNWNPRLQVLLLNLEKRRRQVRIIGESSETQEGTIAVIQPTMTRQQLDRLSIATAA